MNLRRGNFGCHGRSDATHGHRHGGIDRNVLVEFCLGQGLTAALPSDVIGLYVIG